MSGPLILLLIVLGLVALWACIKIAGRSNTATNQLASPASVTELAVSETEAAPSQALNNSLDPDVFRPLKERVLERTEGLDFFQAMRHFDPLIDLRDGDIDGARQVMQRLSYLVYEDRDTHPEQVAQFTALMCKFVQIDPLFWRELGAITPVVRERPGILQTELYSLMDVDLETARYVLYFAHETGHLVRQKKGRTYAVFLPDQVTSETAEQAWVDAIGKINGLLEAAGSAETVADKRKHVSAARQMYEDVSRSTVPPDGMRESVVQIKQILDALNVVIEAESVSKSNADAPAQIAVKLTSSVFVHETEDDRRYAELNRQATQVKSSSYAQAVVLLKEAKAIKGDSYVDTRLAKFLQSAGQFDEALSEIQWLIDRSHAWALDMFSHQPQSVLLRQRAVRRAEIYDAAVLICTRQGRPDLVTKYKHLRRVCRDAAARLDPIADADRKARDQAWKDASAQKGLQATQAFHAACQLETARNEALQDSSEEKICEK